MDKFNYENRKSLDKSAIFNLVEKNLVKSDIESKNELKREIFNYSFGLIEKGNDKKSLKKHIVALFDEIKSKSYNIKEVFKNDKIDNAVNNIYINYHINKFKTTDSKIEKDIQFSKINNELSNFVINVVHKENMGQYDEDLGSAGTIGLYKALSKDYDPMKADFSTFSYIYIRKEIQEEKSKQNGMYNIPIIHNHYYSVYSKIYKQTIGDDSVVFDDVVIEKAAKKLQKTNPGVTVNLIKDIVNNKLNPGASLNQSRGGENDQEIALIDSIEAKDYTSEDIKQGIDNEILRNHLSKFLSKFPDFEKTIIERKFGFDFGGDNTYPIYKIKVTRDGQENIKEMVAVRSRDAIKRVELLGYKVLSTKEEVANSKRYETIVGGTIERLKDYFEIQKLTKISSTALKKSEAKIVKQLESYLKDVMKEKDVTNSTITINA